jgi:hypothetical protein
MLCIFQVDVSIPISKKQYDTRQINTNVILKLQFFKSTFVFSYIPVSKHFVMEMYREYGYACLTSSLVKHSC